MLSPLTVVALIPALTSAILLPPNLNPEVEVASVPAIAHSAQSLGIDPFKWIVELPCPDCPFYEGEFDGLKLWSKTKNSLILEFTSSQSQPLSLSVGDHPLFRTTQESFLPLRVPQLPRNDEDSKLPSLQEISALHKVNLGFEAFIDSVAPEVRTVRFHVLSVDGKGTKRNMDIVELTVLQDADGILYLGKAIVRPPTPSEASAAECKMNFLCRWKAYFADKIQSLKPVLSGLPKPGCSGSRPSEVKDHQGGAKEDHGRPHRHGGHHHHHGHHSILENILKFVVLPIFIGSIAGMAISLVGIMVGHLAVVAYRKITGKSAPNCARYKERKQVEEAEGLLAEKRSSVVVDEELPAYTDSEGVLRGDEKI